MHRSVWDPGVQAVLEGATRGPRAPFPSPVDWRDRWIYFLLIDRFDNPKASPRHLPYDDPHFDGFQGGTFEGVRRRLPYLKDLGIGALWLSPFLKNCQFSPDSYHGYGIHDFLSAEPRFATDPADADDELRRVVDAAHDLDILVICDIVLNHTGDVFAYECQAGDSLCALSAGARASFSPVPRQVRWRGADGQPREDWPVVEAIPEPPPDATVWPLELRRNEFFRRQGALPNWQQIEGDFDALKQLLTTDPGFQSAMIRVYQHVIGKYDVDGFRIDTLKYLSPGYARTFANAVREYALSIGKKNFFTFGEVFDGEDRIARFVGRDATDIDDPVGVDAALDFPLVFTLPRVAKGWTPPAALTQMYERRKQLESVLLSSHGDASGYFVTFLDNHDLKRRFYFCPPDDPHRYDDQLTLALACLFCLQGIPCLYYGTEQGLHGDGDLGLDATVREALWGKGPDAFDPGTPFYRAVQSIARVRAEQPALRYGRQYFRPVSGDGHTFALSGFAPGVLAFSRILNDEEVVIAANPQLDVGCAVDVIVDSSLNPPGTPYRVLYSNKGAPQPPGLVKETAKGEVTVREVGGATTDGPVRAIRTTLQPLEAQILGR